MNQPEESTADEVARRKALLAQKMVLVLPGFGRWASKIRDFETPYGSAGIRQLEVLYHLRHDLLDPKVPVATALADKFQVQHSVITRILKKLETAGYISREPDLRDGRAWQIAITETGRKLSDYVEAEFFKEMEAALGDQDEGDLACLERSIGLLIGVGGRLGMGDMGRLVRRSGEQKGPRGDGS